MGPGGAGRRYLGAEDAGWSVPGAEDKRGGCRRGAEGLGVRGPPSPPGAPSLLACGGRLRAEVAETRGGARRRPGGRRLGGSVPGRPPAHVAPPRSPARPRLCVGQQVPGLPRPCVRVPAPPAGCPGTPEGHCVRPLGGVRGGTSAAAPQPPGDWTLLGWDVPAAGPRSRSQSPRRPPPPPAGGAPATPAKLGAASPLTAVEFPKKTPQHARKSCQNASFAQVTRN